MEEKNQFCHNCYFFMQTSQRDDQRIGYCRANPPAPYFEREGENGETRMVPKVARFPVVLGNMWCGAWDSRVEVTDNE
jgi:hypothetical protein